MAKNPIGTVLALSAVSAVALLILHLQPLFIGSAARQFGFNDVELGYFASLPAGASFLVFLSAPLWLNRLPIRTSIFVGCVLSALALFAMSLANSAVTLTAFFAFYAIGVSIIQVPALVALGRMPDAESAFGVYVTSSVIMAGVLAFLIPAVVEPALGFNGFLYVVLAATLGATLFIHRLSEADLEADDQSTDTTQGGIPDIKAIIVLAALVILYVGIIGAWAFLERLGSQAGLDGNELGIAFATALLIGGTGPFVAAYFGDRISTVTATGITVALFSIFILLLLIGDVTWVTFGLALVSFNIAWNFGIPYLLAVVGRADASGRALALAPAAMALGAGGGPALGGNLLSSQGPTGLIMAFGVVLAISFAMFLWVNAQNAHQPDIL
ncbi:MAG: hypothetical protein AAFX52_13880 [Pseudomonadota bacterium]